MIADWKEAEQLLIGNETTKIAISSEDGKIFYLELKESGRTKRKIICTLRKLIERLFLLNETSNP